MFKILIVIIFILIIISLFTAMYFLFKDQSRSQRTLKSLLLRVVLAALLLLMISIGFYSGELLLRTPFPVNAASHQIDKQE
ncbi:twin transmembrane helix small protein [Amphritea sp. 1_MG-2023]|uniref:twin transmembrane helix small protein n=1 Tax=Amphritea sp. 1_MG-2023 TaxID=3062670 RepID=UPI0026E3D308|nr:twin transmembrane helix small protein [Amphritea sp. 1_MG-2023]MDO6563867.1 twin transmembrane helix small protein [Amphritea sp. 1_MG-2023]